MSTTALTLLPVNKTVVFYSPVEGKDTLVRTGTIAEGSCFFHALLHAYSKDYVSMNQRGRMKFVKRLRSSIARKIDKNKWEHLSDGLIAKIPFQENINNLLSEFYRFVHRGKIGRTKSVRRVIRDVILDNKSDLEAYKLVTEMLPLEKTFEKDILPSVYEKCNESPVSQCKNDIVKYSVKYYIKIFDDLKGQLSQEMMRFYLNKLEKLMTSVVNEAEQYAYCEYIESLNDVSTEVDSYTIGLISEKFNRDVYFIDSRTRMPYRDVNDQNIKKRKSIIVMWTGGCHYEVVGKLLPGNRIQREFSHDDSLIQCLYTYLYNPDKVPNKYPNLIPYLPKELRLKLGTHNSHSENDRSSSHASSSRRSISNTSNSHRSKSEDIENSSAYENSDSDVDIFDRMLNTSNGQEHNEETPIRPSLEKRL